VVDYQELRRSLQHLESQFANWQSAKDRPELRDLAIMAFFIPDAIQLFQKMSGSPWP